MPRDPGVGGDVSRTSAVAVLLLIGVSLFAGLGASDLQEPDEGRYGDVSAAMSRTGHWLTPELNGIGYFSKPPLAFWASALAVEFFGPEEWAVRLPSALAGFATLLLVYHWAARSRGRRAGLLAALLLASIPLFAMLVRVVMVDGLLTLWITLALYAGFRAVVREGTAPDGTTEPPVPRRFSLLFWSAAALAFLTKGPIGVALPASAIVTYCLLVRRPGRLRAFLRPLDLLAFVAIASPWYVAVCVAHPEYARQFFFEQNLERFATGGPFRRQKQVWYYVPVLLVTALPWTLTLPFAVREALRQRLIGRRESLGQFLVVTLVVWFLVLCAAQSKLAYYLLPLMPPLALGLAAWLELRIQETRRSLLARPAGRAVLASTAVMFLGLALVALLVRLGTLDGAIEARTVDLPGPTAERVLRCVRASAGPGALGLLLLGLGLGAAWLGTRRPQPWRAVIGVALGFTMLLACVPFAVGGLAPLISVRPLAEAIREHRVEGQPILIYGRYARGLPFYLQETVSMWDARPGEFGQRLEPGAYGGRCLQKDDALLVAMVQRPGGTWLVVDELDDLVDFESHSGHGYEVVYSQAEWILARTGPEFRAAPAQAPRVLPGESTSGSVPPDATELEAAPGRGPVPEPLSHDP